ncbi:hypothetical protein [Bradyrhizobium sp. ARR65]|uniref:hypothetical protein n=1 Tax=Bradyrhizobium sp. ARR65 TaxID=1040989 RepID=UPI00046390A0|nr:hypothetical protein [Bradyrhizobium sp. ARR65]
MSRLATALFAGVTATLLSVAAFMSAAAAAPSKADKTAAKQAVIACKAEAKGRKVKWLARRRYVNHCVTEALKDRPNLDVTQLLKQHPNLTDLPVEQWPGF